MKTITCQQIAETVKELCRNANTKLNEDVIFALKKGREQEQSEIAKDILDTIIENADLAANLQQPLCQDTGIAVFFVEQGQEVIVTGGDVRETIQQAMSDVYLSEPYRLSVVKDPYFDRTNSGNNLPAIIHWEIVPGDEIKITFMPKGGGAENMSHIKMFTPLSHLGEIKQYILESVISAGGKPCPPIILGIGIGGSFDYAAYLAKKALLRPLSESHKNDKWAELEHDLLAEINKTGIGPMGLGGLTTALAVNILTYPCHIASMPVAINFQCHSHRYKTAIIT